MRFGCASAIRNPTGHAIILHVKRVAREAYRFGEAIYDLRQIVERVSELFWVWPVAMPEARVIGSDKVIAIGKEACEEGLAHPETKRQAGARESLGTSFSSPFPIKNGESVDLNRTDKKRAGGLSGRHLLLIYWQRTFE